MLQIRPAEEAEFPQIRAFYYALIDEMQSAAYKPRWEKGVYPSDDYLLESVRSGQLYLGFCGGIPAAAMGFRYVKTVNMFYEDTGWTDFLLYEYLL